jgi:hypothetical protein
MSDLPIEAKELLSQWIGQKVLVGFSIYSVSLSPQGMGGLETSGKGHIIELLDNLLRVERLSGEEILITPNNGAFLVEYTVHPNDRSQVVVRNWNHSIVAQFWPESD